MLRARSEGNYIHPHSTNRKSRAIKELNDQLKMLGQEFNKAKKPDNRKNQENFCIKLYSFLQTLGGELCHHVGNSHRLSPLQCVAASWNLFEPSDICQRLEKDSKWYTSLADTVKELDLSDYKNEDPISYDLLDRLNVFRKIADEYFIPRVTRALEEAIAHLSAVTPAVRENLEMITVEKLRVISSNSDEDFVTRATGELNDEIAVLPKGTLAMLDKLAVIMILVMFGELIPLSEQLERNFGKSIVKNLKDLRDLFVHLNLSCIWALLDSGNDGKFECVVNSILALQGRMGKSDDSDCDRILTPLNDLKDLVSEQRQNPSNEDARYIDKLLKTVFTKELLETVFPRKIMHSNSEDNKTENEGWKTSKKSTSKSGSYLAQVKMLKIFLRNSRGRNSPARYVLAAICEYFKQKSKQDSGNDCFHEVGVIRNYYFHCQWVYEERPSRDVAGDIVNLYSEIADARSHA